MWYPKELTAAQREARRFEAVRLLRSGRVSHAEIARQLGVSRAAVSQWAHQLAQTGRRAGLARRAHPGRPSQMSEAAWRKLFTILRRGARASGFETERWTLRRIAVVVERELGVTYHPCSLSPLLRARSWSPQRPATRARERNEALIAAWLQRDWPAVKRGLAEAGSSSPSWMKRVTRFGPA